MVTIDIESLYTNIRQKDALIALRWALKRESKLKKIQINFLIKGLEIAMSNNYFWANNQYYNQIGGVAMGARYAPSVANIVLNKWEQETVFLDQHFSLCFYRRYIDDVILFWEGPEASLKLFLEKMNRNNYGLTFTAETSMTTVNYLDLTIRKKGEKFQTLTYFKATDRNGFVPTSSCHNPLWIGAVPKGQYMRLKRNCDTDEDFCIQAKHLTNRFLEKGYAADTLQQVFNQVSVIDRKTLLTSKPKKEFKSEAAFISGFHRQYRQVEAIFKRHWPILMKDKDLKSSISGVPKFIYRKAPGLRKIK